MINYYVIQIKGKNPKRILSKLFKLGIDIYDIEYGKNVITFKTTYINYAKIKSIKTTYEINIIKTSGINRIKYLFKRYRMFLIFFLLSIFTIILFTNFVLFINYETESTELKTLLKSELEKNGITLYSYSKNYHELETIKNKIKNDNKTKIEWIELERKGVVLNVKVIERKDKNKKTITDDATDIVASKNGYIRDIYASSGEILKNKDDYVKKGDVIVSGNIFRNENVIARVKSNATVYAEVWYVIKANMSDTRSILTKSDDGESRLIINIFNKDLSLFKINKKISNEKENVLMKNNLLTLKIQNKKNTHSIKKKYTDKEMITILHDNVISSMNKSLEDKEYIIYEKVLKNYKENGKMFIEVFIKTYEDISLEKESKKLEENKQD